jgi:hypothetical protein
LIQSCSSSLPASLLLLEVLSPSELMLVNSDI